MKRIILLAVCVLYWVSAWAAESTITFTTQDSPRVTSSGYVDWVQVVNKPGCRLLNVFGYNSGPQQWVQLYNSTNGIVISVVDSTAANKTITGGVGVYLGEPLQLTNTTAGVGAGIYYARPITNSQVIFQLYDTKAHAVNSAATTGIQTTTDAGSGNIQLLPRHTFAVAQTDNYSFIIPGTGMGFGAGIVVAASTTGPTFTPPSTNITICATYLP